MKYFVTVGADGRRTATYLEGHPAIPEGAIEIDEATFREWIENDGTRRWENGRLVECEPPPASAPIPQEEIVAQRIDDDPALQAIIRALADKLGESPDQMLDRIKAATAS